MNNLSGAPPIGQHFADSGFSGGSEVMTTEQLRQNLKLAIQQMCWGNPNWMNHWDNSEFVARYQQVTRDLQLLRQISGPQDQAANEELTEFYRAAQGLLDGRERSPWQMWGNSCAQPQMS